MKPVIALVATIDKAEADKLEAAGYVVIRVVRTEDCQLIHPGNDDSRSGWTRIPDGGSEALRG